MAMTVAKDKGRIFDTICLKLTWPRGSLGGLKKRAKWIWDTAGTPAITAANARNHPAEIGELCYNKADGSAWIVTVAPIFTDLDGTCAATFVQLHA